MIRADRVVRLVECRVLNVHEVMWSLSECWIGSAVDFAARASRSLKSETGLA